MSKASKRAATPNVPWPLDEPPAGVRLQAATVASWVGITMKQMGEATNLGQATVFRAICENQWPARTEREAVQQQLHALLAQAGATPEELARLWWAQGPGALGGGRRYVSPEAAARGPRVDRHNRPMNPDGTRAVPQPNAEEGPQMLLMKQVLAPQAARHFKLFRDPFQGEVRSEAQFFRGPEIRYFSEATWSCARNGGFMALVGESGAGKTTIVDELEARLEREPERVIVIRPSVLGLEERDSQGHKIKAGDILHAICTTLAPNAPVPQTVQARTTAARKLLAASAQAGTSHLLLIEEAHGLPGATLKHLKRLHEMKDGRRQLLAIMLVAQPELKTRLHNGLVTGELREVAQRCEVVELLPLDSELKGYLQTRVTAAGGELDKLIDGLAIEALRKRLTKRDRASGAVVSMCYPLAVNNMMTKALNAAAELGLPVINAELVGGL
jgi:type II secretory pathway predicted ATPase ExeA